MVLDIEAKSIKATLDLIMWHDLTGHLNGGYRGWFAPPEEGAEKWWETVAILQGANVVEVETVQGVSSSVRLTTSGLEYFGKREEPVSTK